MQQYRLDQKEPALITLIVMSSFASMGAVIFTPALPAIADYFKVSDGHSQLTVTLFLVGYALGQLIYGPLSNRFGRKKAFYIGIMVATLGSLISIFSEPLNSFGFLILGRMLEALGSSAGLVISFTIINDHYFPEQARRIISYMTLAFAVVPGVALFIGGLLISHFHWISCFYFLLIYGLLLAIPVSRLMETAKKIDLRALYFKDILINYSIAFKNKTLRYISLFFGLSAMCIYGYAASAPFIAIHDLGISPEKFGIIGLIPFIGTGLGSLVSAHLSKTLSAKTVIKMGWAIEAIASLFFAILFYLGIISFLILIIAGFVFMFGGCLVMSNCTSIATSKLDDKANASAVMNFINVGMSVFGTFLLAITPGDAVFKLPGIFILALVCMFGVWQFIKRIP
ncbi:MAG: hypothetical protein A3E87_00320 [Gammaproteobacteria bacterium RIFCSPHIGHO2_12_FULL_35_23]|nr:MAG: hypothetical protein A3E87_00320 [Gammaproteobacteria bacterium RIFCSPHIGHO2_12_FULL_35_23]